MTFERAKKFIDEQTWTFAKTYANKAPHEYIVRGKCHGTDTDFLEMAYYIQEQGVTMHYWGHPNKYLFPGDKYYWVMKDDNNDATMIINRSIINDYYISVSWKGQSHDGQNGSAEFRSSN